MSQRPTLRRNHGRYLGERIAVDPVQRQSLGKIISRLDGASATSQP